MKTYSAKPREIEQAWYWSTPRARPWAGWPPRSPTSCAARASPQYTPHVDTGDFVVVVNAEKVHVTGKKLEQKIYYRHSGYPGGLRERTLAEQLERRPEEVIRKAVKGMLPKNKLAAAPARQAQDLRRARSIRTRPRTRSPHRGATRSEHQTARRLPRHRQAQDLGRPRRARCPASGTVTVNGKTARRVLPAPDACSRSRPRRCG